MLCALVPIKVAGQDARVTGIVAGRVFDASLGSAIPAAALLIEGTAIRATTDSAGAFRLVGVPRGPHVLLARRIGYAPARVPFTMAGVDSVVLDVPLARSSLELPAISVTADATGRARGELGTADVIGRDAITNQVAASLAGVLELVPGIVLSPPGLDAVQQIPLRSVPTSSPTFGGGGPSASELSSFGTLIVLDGVPTSNNANLQTTGPRGELQFLLSTSAGGGIDLRRIPASTLDRVEVIRGVPSVRYGDLTQGAVVVETRAGEIDPLVTARYDARTAEVSFAAGRRLGAGQHIISGAADLANTRLAPGVTEDNAYRLATQLAHRAQLGQGDGNDVQDDRLVLDSRVDFFQVQQNSPEREEVVPGRASTNSDNGIRLSQRARLALGSSSRLEFTWALDHTRQRSFAQSLLVRGAMPFTDRLEEGRAFGHFIGGEYLSRLELQGNSWLLYARLEGARPLGSQHELRFGAEVRREWNSGPGYQFDIEFPPQVRFNGVQGFDRPRRFDDIPAVLTSSLYLDDRLPRLSPFGVPLDLQGGLRLDLLYGPPSVRAALQPRLNAQVSPLSWLRVRAGAGITAKLPPLGSLFPAPQYYDVVNVNWYTPDPRERLAVLTTFIRDPTNPAISFSHGRKAEVGIEAAPLGGGFGVSATWFHDRTTEGVGLRFEPSFLLRDRYDLSDSTQGTGVPPTIIEPAARADTVPILIERPANNLTLDSHGIEVNARLPEVRPLQTRLEVQAAWVRTAFYQDGLDFGTTFEAFQLDERLPRAPYWQGVTRTGERVIVTYRVIHHQPELGLVVSATLQHYPYEKRGDIGAIDSLAFSGYVTRSGRLVPVAASERGDAQYADLRVPRANTFVFPTEIAPDWLLNLQVSKTLPLDGRLSFFAFNVLDRQGRFPTATVEGRQFAPLRFGLEVSMPIAPLLP